MKYMGSKSRIAKEILPIILKDRQPEQWYVEPFVGGGNLIDKVDGNRIGADNSEYVIEALKLIRDFPETLPKNNTETNEEDYQKIRKSEHQSIGLKGYYGFSLSYGGKFFGGYRRDKIGKRDYINEAYRDAIKQSKKLQGVVLCLFNYYELPIPTGSIIYCDPPYQGTTKYMSALDYEIFWEWCRVKSKTNKVFISEYNAPDDFECIWQKEITSSLTKDTGSKKGIEKLFIWKGD
jgi:DNA adenine methylase